MAQPIETKLSVNLNKVALLRNQRDVGYPSVVEAARLVVAAGATASRSTRVRTSGTSGAPTCASWPR